MRGKKRHCCMNVLQQILFVVVIGCWTTANARLYQRPLELNTPSLLSPAPVGVPQPLEQQQEQPEQPEQQEQEQPQQDTVIGPIITNEDEEGNDVLVIRDSSGVQSVIRRRPSHGLQCGIATEGVPAQGVSEGCDGLLKGGKYLKYGFGFDGCSYNKDYLGPSYKTPYCLPEWGELFNLVDEPTDYAQAARDWIAFADTHSTDGTPFRELVRLGRVTTPGATGDADEIIRDLTIFFDNCPGCEDPTSHRFVGTISFHSFANTNLNIPPEKGGSAFAPFVDNVQYIVDTKIPAIAQQWPAPRWNLAMTNLGVIGATSTAEDQIALLNEFFSQYNKAFSPAKGKLQYLYYFAAQDHCGEATNPPWEGCGQHNSLCEPGVADTLNRLCYGA